MTGEKKVNYAKEIGQGSFFLLSSNLLCTISEFFLVVLLVRLLPPEIYGLYGLAMSIIFSIYAITSLGFGEPSVYFISRYRTKKDAASEKSAVGITLLVKQGLSLVCALIILGSREATAIGVYQNPDLLVLLGVGAVLVIVMSLFNTCLTLFHAYKMLRFMAALNLIASISKLILTGVLVYLLTDAYAVILGLFLSQLLACIVALLFLKKVLPLGIKGPWFNKRIGIKMIKYGFFLLVSLIGKILFERSGPLYLGYLQHLEGIGHYTFAYQIALAFFTLAASLGASLFPYLSSLYAEKRIDKIQQILNTGIKYLAILILPVVFGTPFVSKYLIGFLGREAYVPAAVFLNVLMIMTCFRILSNPLVIVLQSIGDPRPIGMYSLVTGVLNAIVIIIVMPIFGPISIAIANMVSYATFFFLLCMKVGKKRICVRYKNMVPPLVASGVMSLVLLWIAKYLIVYDVLGVVLIMVVGCISYFASLYLMKGFTKEDITFLLSSIR